MQYITGNNRKNFDVFNENWVLQDFLVFKGYARNQIKYPDPEPSDALIEIFPNRFIWVEVLRVVDERTTEYLYDDEMCLKEDRYEISSIDFFVDKVKYAVNKKDEKQSYFKLVQQYGKGVLLFDILDPLVNQGMQLIIANQISDFYNDKDLKSFIEIYLYRQPKILPKFIKLK